MKKTLLLAALVAVAMSANAQWFDFKNNVHRYEIGVNLGMPGLNTEFYDFGIGASLSAWGVYIDFLHAGPKYKYDNHIADMTNPAAMVPDSTTWTLNVGYQIPVLPWLRIMPIIGHCHNTSGYTDYSTVNVEVSGDEYSATGQMYHDYIKQKGHGTLNFGGGLIVSPIRWMSIYGVYTTHAIYGGITFNLSALSSLAEE